MDVLFSPNFFKMNRTSVHKWCRIFERLSQDRTLAVSILQKFQTSSTPQSMLSAMVQSQDDEAAARGRLLKRLAFFVFSSPSLDREFLSAVCDRVSDTIRTFSKIGRYAPIRYALLVFRVLMVRAAPQLLGMFWPVILPEMIRVLSTPPSGDEDFYLCMEVLKIVDFSICILPSEFQVFRWVFFDDEEVIESAAAVRLRSFVPLVRSLHDRRPLSFNLWALRRDIPSKETSAGWTASTDKARLRPLLAIPERCYFDIRGIDVVSGALTLYSTAISTNIVEGADDDNDVVDGPLAEAELLIRHSDRYDYEYVRWLLEAEFLHVGIAASEQHLALGARMSPERGRETNSIPPATADPGDGFIDVVVSPNSRRPVA
jgi:hypothetical protein